MDDIDGIDNPLSNLAIKRKYYDITDLRIDSELNGHKHQLTALHINTVTVLNHIWKHHMTTI